MQDAPQCDKMNYNIKTYTVILAGNYIVNDKLSFDLSNTYTIAKTDMKEPGFRHTTLSGSYDYDLSDIEQYSELDISKIELFTNARYMIHDNVALNLGIGYLRYNDYEPYLEDNTGDVYTINFSLQYFF